MKLYQVYEEDLRFMETAIPVLFERLGCEINDPKIQVIAEELKRIVSDVRWDYGPPSEVQVVKT